MKKTINEIINGKGLTVRQAAEVCGLSVHTVTSHFYGRRKTMTLPIAAKYAKGLGVAMEEIVSGGDAA